MIYYISQVAGTIYDNYKYWLGNLDLSWLDAFNYNVPRDNNIFDEYLFSQPNNSSTSKSEPTLDLAIRESIIDESKLILIEKEETIILNKKIMDRVIDGHIEISYLYIDPLYNEDEPIEIRLGDGQEGLKKSIIGYRINNNVIIIRVGGLVENIVMCPYKMEVNLLWKNGRWIFG
jgi:hypothetical protein